MLELSRFELVVVVVGCIVAAVVDAKDACDLMMLMFLFDIVFVLGGSVVGGVVVDIVDDTVVGEGLKMPKL